MFDQIIDYIGFYGPEILLVSSIILLRNKRSFITIYTIGFAVNALVNYVLKGVFMQPRPTDEVHLFQLEKLYRKTVGFDHYGMPSGHLQTTLYSTVFIMLALKDEKITGLYLIVSLVSMYQRIKFKHHTLLQTLVGALVGSIIGYLVYQYAIGHLQGKVKRRADENASG